MYIIAYGIFILIILTSIFSSTVYIRKHEYYANAVVKKKDQEAPPPPEEDVDFDPDDDETPIMDDVDSIDDNINTTTFESPRVSIATRTVDDPPSILTNHYQCANCAEDYTVSCDDVTTNIKQKEAQCNANCVYYTPEDRELRSCIPACYSATHPVSKEKDSKKATKCNISNVMNIFVIGPDPDTKTSLSVSPDYTIADVKNEIKTKMGIPFLKQKITIGTTLLDNNKTLEYYNITENMNVYLTPVRLTIYDCYKCANRMRKKSLGECFDKCQYFNYENNQNMPCDAACNFKISKQKKNKKPDSVSPVIAK
jgi:hypothetical protein